VLKRLLLIYWALNHVWRMGREREKKIFQLLCFPRRYIRAGDIAGGSAAGKFGAGIWKKASPFSRPTPGSADPRLPAAVR
jgi:hypothetical protein